MVDFAPLGVPSHPAAGVRSGRRGAKPGGSLRRVLVANRGEIAVRIVRACFDEGIESVVAVSDADRDSLAARRADTVVRIGPAASSGRSERKP